MGFKRQLRPRGQDARDTLTGLGYEVEWHSYPMQRHVCLEEIQDVSRWMAGYPE